MTRTRHTQVARVRALSVLALAVVFAGTLSAQEMSVPVRKQLSLFARVLEFDRTLEDRVGAEIVFGIVFQRRFRTSLTTRDAVIEVLHDDVQIAGLPVRYVSLEMADADELRALIIHYGIDVLYVAPLRGVSIDSIALVSQDQQVLTLSGVESYVSQGVTVGIGSHGEQTVVLINLPMAKAVGAKLSSELLKLARIVGDE